MQIAKVSSDIDKRVLKLLLVASSLWSELIWNFEGMKQSPVKRFAVTNSAVSQILLQSCVWDISTK